MVRLGCCRRRGRRTRGGCRGFGRLAVAGSENGDETSSSNPFTGGASLSAGSRPASFSGARSEVLHWTRDAGVKSVWKFTDETVYSLLWSNDRLWVGTGLEGKLYSHQSERMMLEKDVDQSQIVALLPSDSGPAFATTNGAALFRFTRGMERKGTLTSDVFDAELLWRAGALDIDLVVSHYA